MKLSGSFKSEKIKSFNKCLINACLNNLSNFEYEGQDYIVSSYGEFVQTLIDNKILYRIYKNEEKNTDELIEDLVRCMN